MHFEQTEYGSKSIERYSSILNQQFDTLKPSWLETLIQFTELQDESGFLQLGYDDTTEYLSFRKEELYPSSWQNHPMQDPNGLYKYVSFDMNLD